ncbi:Vab2p PWA37_005312 [Arxiozyma heterogenica]
MLGIILKGNIQTEAIIGQRVMTDSDFKPIQGSNALYSLKKEIIIPKYTTTTYNSIFQQVKNELKQVETDIVHIFNTISTDIHCEMKQEELLDLKLKSTLKHLKHSYKRISKLRIKSSKYHLQNDTCIFSKHLYHMESSISKLEKELKNLQEVSNSIINNIIIINDNFIKQNNMPMVTLKNYTESQYPILFKLIKQKNPKIITQQTKTQFHNYNYMNFELGSEENSLHGQTESANAEISSSNNPKGYVNLHKNNTTNTPKFVTDKGSISNPYFNATNSKLIPPFLKIRPHPSTYTTLQNIHGDYSDKSNKYCENSSDI